MAKIYFNKRYPWSDPRPSLGFRILIHRQRAGPVSLPCGVTAVAGKTVKAVRLFITVVTVVTKAVMGPQLLPNDRRKRTSRDSHHQQWQHHTLTLPEISSKDDSASTL